MDHASQERTCRDHDGSRRKPSSVQGFDASYRSVLDRQARHGPLHQLEVRPPLEQGAHRAAVQAAIALRPRRPHRGPLGSVEHPELDARQVGRSAHDATERIHFAYDRPLRDSADRGIARHLPDGFEILREQQRPRAGTRRERGGFGAGVAAADHDYVIAFWHAGNLRLPRNGGEGRGIWRDAEPVIS
jgi:hypothetical protein